MSHNNLPPPNRVQASEAASLAFCIAVPLLLFALYCELGTIQPTRNEALGLAAFVLISDACLLVAWWRGGTVMRVLTTLCGLVALPNTFSVLEVTAKFLF